MPKVLSPQGARGPLSGRSWPGYEIGDLLGCGGMAEVYRAWQGSVGRIIALKAMPAGVSDPGLRARFAAEAAAAARIDSPHVVRIHDSGEHDGQMWLAMEYVDGHSLADLLRERTPDPAEAARLTLQAARGLAAAHALGLVHRDIKPANLLLAADGTVKVADFGLVRILDGRTLTRTGTILGTPQYLAPEQGRGLATGPSGDVYSLGVVLYELLTGQPPFAGETADALIFQHNFAEPQLPTELDPAIPPDLQAVCIRCLNKDPERRYADAAALAGDLARVADGAAPLTAQFAPGGLDTGAAAALRRAGGGRRWRLPAAIAAAILVAAALWWWHIAERRAAIAELRARLAPVALAQPLAATVSGDLEALAGLVGIEDPLVAAGRRKLAGIATTANDLDTAVAAGAAGRVDAGLVRLAELVGPDGDPRMARWRSWLAGQGARIEALRARLAPELAGRDTLPRAVRDRIGGELDAFLAGAAAADPDRAAWQRLLERTATAADQLRARLARCADPRPVPAADLPALATDLDALAGIAGDAAIDPAWRARIGADTRDVAAARAALARFLALAAPAADDAGDARSAVATLRTHQALGSAEAAEVERRLAAIDRRADELAALRGRAAALEGAPGPLPTDADALVDNLAGLAGARDAQAARLRTRLAAQRRLEAELDAWDGLAVLPDPVAAAATLDAYRALAGDDPRATRAARRLDDLRGPGVPAWAAAGGRDVHGPWADLEVAGARLRLRWLPPLTGAIGSPPDEPGRDPGEVQVQVRLSRGRWIADRECPQALWTAVMGTHPARSRDPGLPVESVSAGEAEAFCARLAELRPGCAARLPTEAEWELAMRAGATGAFGAISDAQAASAVVWRGSGLVSPRPAGSGPANALGLHDGPGNVWEWCTGSYGPMPIGSPAIDPQPPPGPRRVARGGSWGDPLASCRLARRLALDAATRSCYLGFRIAVPEAAP